MRLLIDYGNVQEIEKLRGLKNLLINILQRIGTEHFKDGEMVQVRLYDGWYEGDVLSKEAQRIATEISELSPFPMVLRSNGETKTLRVSVEMARSLVADPSKDILHTFRLRGFPSGLNCSPPPFTGCINPHTCPIQGIAHFLNQRTCPKPRCDLHPKKLITRAEQKIVDTMLTADIISLSDDDETVCVVSSDDDMWPGIRLALSTGARVIHVHNKKGQEVPRYYTDHLPDRYTQILVT